jgi:pyruvate/2-oxoglutarate dehydrogenase complex dihydrolipoamide acyltransferase (E2) component
MTGESPEYRVVDIPLARRAVLDSLRLSHRKHTVYGLLEMDVTEARQSIGEHEAKTGEKLSFTAFIIACLARAVAANRYMHGYRNWRNKLVLFDDVDVCCIFEIELEGTKFPLAHVIRAANRRGFRDIHEEIRRVQANPRSSPSLKAQDRVKWLLLAPGFLRDLVYRLMLKSPHRLKAQMGTVVLTAVGMFGQGGGWGIPTTHYTLGVTLGGTARKPGVVEGRIEVRDYLGVTIAMDHDIIDGAPGARFADRFRDLVEQGYGLAGVGQSPGEPP